MVPGLLSWTDVWPHEGWLALVLGAVLVYLLLVWVVLFFQAKGSDPGNSTLWVAIFLPVLALVWLVQSLRERKRRRQPR